MSLGVVAFSGGLDTSFLVPFSRTEYGLDEIITVTVNTGGFSEAELEKIEARSRELGADKHFTVDGQQHYYDTVVKYLIFGNVTRDGYPLCGGAERLTQAVKVLEYCRKYNATHFLHGSTGAGNDQYRFELVAYALGNPGLKVLAPVRERGFSREYETEFLRNNGYPVEHNNSVYSYNLGMWGITIHGGETHLSSETIPDDAWYSKPNITSGEETLTLQFEKGEVVTLAAADGTEVSGATNIIRALAHIGNRRGIGRHYHVGTSVPGKKGRLAYESPAADIIYEAHRALEKVTLTGLQIHGKRPIADEFGRLIHEAKFLDPYCDDIRVFLSRTQMRVTGTARVTLAPGYIKSVTVESPYNLLHSKEAKYGETSSYYNGADASGAVKLHCLEQVIFERVGNSPSDSWRVTSEQKY